MQFVRLKKKKLVDHLAAQQEAAQEAVPEPTKAELAQRARDERRLLNDPEFSAQENLATVWRVQQLSGDQTAEISESEKMIHALCTDPLSYFQSMDTNLSTSGGRHRGLVKALTKRFLKEHPRYAEGYIGMPSTLRRRMADLDIPLGGGGPELIAAWFRVRPLHNR